MSEIHIHLERIEKDGKPIAPYKYRTIYDGKELGAWRDPECSAARELLAHGHARRRDVLVIYRGSMPCMRGEVGWFADRSVRDAPSEGPAFVKWRPMVDLS